MVNLKVFPLIMMLEWEQQQLVTPLFSSSSYLSTDLLRIWTAEMASLVLCWTLKIYAIKKYYQKFKWKLIRSKADSIERERNAIQIWHFETNWMGDLPFKFLNTQIFFQILLRNQWASQIQLKLWEILVCATCEPFLWV